jgi:lactaldehyde reductase
MANRFVLNETSYHGKGAIESIPEEAKARGFKKALVCSDPDLVKFGVTAKVTDLLDKAGLAYELYSNIKPNPTIENVQQGVKALHDAGADYMIAIGGGSSMDTAKAVGIIDKNPEFADVRSLEGVAPTKNPCTPIFAVPTTAGTAAEVTINYVITDVEKDRKMVCVDVHDIPVVAFVDPDMMSSMPKGLTAATGMDALTHAVEAYIGNSTTPGTRKNALDAVQLIFENLDRAYTNGSDKEARKNMLRASYFAGCAFTKSYVGYVHAVAHTLGGQYNVPHGLANAVILPFVLEEYGKTIYSKLARLAQAAGVADSDTSEEVAAKAFIQAIKDMKKRFNIGDTIPEIKEEDIPKLAHYADKEGNPLYPVPVLMDAHELEKFYYILMDKKQEDTSNESE